MDSNFSKMTPSDQYDDGIVCFGSLTDSQMERHKRLPRYTVVPSDIILSNAYFDSDEENNTYNKKHDKNDQSTLNHLDKSKENSSVFSYNSTTFISPCQSQLLPSVSLIDTNVINRYIRMETMSSDESVTEDQYKLKLKASFTSPCQSQLFLSDSLIATNVINRYIRMESMSSDESVTEDQYKSQSKASFSSPCTSQFVPSVSLIDTDVINRYIRMENISSASFTSPCQSQLSSSNSLIDTDVMNIRMEVMSSGGTHSYVDDEENDDSVLDSFTYENVGFVDVQKTEDIHKKLEDSISVNKYFKTSEKEQIFDLRYFKPTSHKNASSSNIITQCLSFHKSQIEKLSDSSPFISTMNAFDNYCNKYKNNVAVINDYSSETNSSLFELSIMHENRTFDSTFDDHAKATLSVIVEKATLNTETLVQSDHPEKVVNYNLSINSINKNILSEDTHFEIVCKSTKEEVLITEEIIAEDSSNIYADRLSFNQSQIEKCSDISTFNSTLNACKDDGYNNISDIEESIFSETTDSNNESDSSFDDHAKSTLLSEIIQNHILEEEIMVKNDDVENFGNDESITDIILTEDTNFEVQIKSATEVVKIEKIIFEDGSNVYADMLSLIKTETHSDINGIAKCINISHKSPNECIDSFVADKYLILPGKQHLSNLCPDKPTVHEKVSPSNNTKQYQSVHQSQIEKCNNVSTCNFTLNAFKNYYYQSQNNISDIVDTIYSEITVSDKKIDSTIDDHAKTTMSVIVEKATLDTETMVQSDNAKKVVNDVSINSINDNILLSENTNFEMLIKSAKKEGGVDIEVIKVKDDSNIQVTGLSLINVSNSLTTEVKNDINVDDKCMNISDESFNEIKDSFVADKYVNITPNSSFVQSQIEKLSCISICSSTLNELEDNYYQPKNISDIEEPIFSISTSSYNKNDSSFNNHAISTFSVIIEKPTLEVESMVKSDDAEKVVNDLSINSINESILSEDTKLEVLCKSGVNFFFKIEEIIAEDGSNIHADRLPLVTVTNSLTTETENDINVIAECLNISGKSLSESKNSIFADTFLIKPGKQHLSDLRSAKPTVHETASSSNNTTQYLNVDQSQIKKCSDISSSNSTSNAFEGNYNQSQNNISNIEEPIVFVKTCLDNKIDSTFDVHAKTALSVIVEKATLHTETIVQSDHVEKFVNDLSINSTNDNILSEGTHFEMLCKLGEKKVLKFEEVVVEDGSNIHSDRLPLINVTHSLTTETKNDINVVAECMDISGKSLNGSKDSIVTDKYLIIHGKQHLSNLLCAKPTVHEIVSSSYNTAQYLNDDQSQIEKCRDISTFNSTLNAFEDYFYNNISDVEEPISSETTDSNNKHDSSFDNHAKSTLLSEIVENYTLEKDIMVKNDDAENVVNELSINLNIDNILNEDTNIEVLIKSAKEEEGVNIEIIKVGDGSNIQVVGLSLINVLNSPTTKIENDINVIAKCINISGKSLNEINNSVVADEYVNITPNLSFDQSQIEKCSRTSTCNPTSNALENNSNQFKNNISDIDQPIFAEMTDSDDKNDFIFNDHAKSTFSVIIEKPTLGVKNTVKSFDAEKVVNDLSINSINDNMFSEDTNCKLAKKETFTIEEIIAENGLNTHADRLSLINLTNSLTTETENDVNVIAKCMNSLGTSLNKSINSIVADKYLIIPGIQHPSDFCHTIPTFHDKACLSSNITQLLSFNQSQIENCSDISILNSSLNSTGQDYCNQPQNNISAIQDDSIATDSSLFSCLGGHLSMINENRTLEEECMAQNVCCDLSMNSISDKISTPLFNEDTNNKMLIKSAKESIDTGEITVEIGSNSHVIYPSKIEIENDSNVIGQCLINSGISQNECNNFINNITLNIGFMSVNDEVSQNKSSLIADVNSQFFNNLKEQIISKDSDKNDKLNSFEKNKSVNNSILNTSELLLMSENYIKNIHQKHVLNNTYNMSNSLVEYNTEQMLLEEDKKLFKTSITDKYLDFSIKQQSPILVSQEKKQNVFSFNNVQLTTSKSIQPPLFNHNHEKPYSVGEILDSGTVSARKIDFLESFSNGLMNISAPNIELLHGVFIKTSSTDHYDSLFNQTITETYLRNPNSSMNQLNRKNIEKFREKDNSIMFINKQIEASEFSNSLNKIMGQTCDEQFIRKPTTAEHHHGSELLYASFNTELLNSNQKSVFNLNNYSIQDFSIQSPKQKNIETIESAKSGNNATNFIDMSTSIYITPSNHQFVSLNTPIIVASSFDKSEKTLNSCSADDANNTVKLTDIQINNISLFFELPEKSSVNEIFYSFELNRKYEYKGKKIEPLDGTHVKENEVKVDAHGEFKTPSLKLYQIKNMLMSSEKQLHYSRSLENSLKSNVACRKLKFSKYEENKAVSDTPSKIPRKIIDASVAKTSKFNLSTSSLNDNIVRSKEIIPKLTGSPALSDESKNTLTNVSPKVHNTSKVQK